MRHLRIREVPNQRAVYGAPASRAKRTPRTFCKAPRGERKAPPRKKIIDEISMTYNPPMEIFSRFPMLYLDLIKLFTFL